MTVKRDTWREDADNRRTDWPPVPQPPPAPTPPQTTPEQLEARRSFAHTPVKIVWPVFSLGPTNVTITTGDIVFRIENHRYAEQLATADNKRMRDFFEGEAHGIANFFERMKRVVAPE